MPLGAHNWEVHITTLAPIANSAETFRKRRCLGRRGFSLPRQTPIIRYSTDAYLRNLIYQLPCTGWKPESRARKSARMTTSMTGRNLADEIEESTFSEDYGVIASPYDAHRGPPPLPVGGVSVDPSGPAWPTQKGQPLAPHPTPPSPPIPADRSPVSPEHHRRLR